ncbi:hypothetical protein JMJ77_0014102, partial [Colletotrichum scovillei]
MQWQRGQRVSIFGTNFLITNNGSMI